MAISDSTLTARELRDSLLYDSVTGRFTWWVKPANNISVGATAGCISQMNRNHHYVKIRLRGIQYLAHRLAWLYMTGEWPEKWIDHIDGNGTNNEWSNLRKTDHITNQWNARRYKKHQTGLKGVHRHLDRYRSSLFVEGQHLHLGIFDTPEEAHAAYCDAARKHRGEFARFA